MYVLPTFAAKIPWALVVVVHDRSVCWWHPKDGWSHLEGDKLVSFAPAPAGSYTPPQGLSESNHKNTGWWLNQAI